MKGRKLQNAEMPLLQCFCTIFGARQTPCFVAFRALSAFSNAPGTRFCITTHKPARQASNTLLGIGFLRHTLGATSLHQIPFLWHLPPTNYSKFRVLALPGRRTLVFTDILIANAKCESGDILAPATAHTPKNTILDQNVPKSLKILKKPLTL